MKKPFWVKIYKVTEMSEIDITTCETHEQARQAATLMAQEGILEFRKADINYISISFDKEKK